MNTPISEKPMAAHRAWMYYVLPVAALVAVDVAFCVMLDRMFIEQKREIVRKAERVKEIAKPHNQYKILVDPKTSTTEQTYFKLHRNKLEEWAKSVVADPDSIVWKITVKGKDDGVLLSAENTDKTQELNNWSNCLLTRNFHGELVYGRERPPNFKTIVTLHYTSPQDWPEIHQLLVRYRLAVILVIGVSVLLYVWLNRALLRPLVRVAYALETLSDKKQISPVRHATTAFERSFNLLAENERAIHLQSEVDHCLREIRKTQHPDDTFESLLERLPKLVSEAYDAPTVALYRWEGRGELIRAAFVHAGSAPTPPQTIVANGELDEPVTPETSDADARWLTPLRTRGQLSGAVLVDLSQALQPREAAGSVRRILETGMEAARTDADRLAEERNRFGMTLATSMGHDLTNIIATGKWDLQTLDRAKSLGVIQVDSGRGWVYEEAVDGLRQNLHFLQDIVDIYRAVGYARRPSYETVELGQLTKEVTELYSRSTSSRLDIRCTPGAPLRAEVEPRLLKMVLFNLLANASQVIQRRSDGKSGGEVEVAVERHGEGAAIYVRDDGPGIRSPEGDILPDGELHRIFRAGYTTKSAEASGGLGLSWVKHIIEEFHEGKTTAANRAEGGAEFQILFPQERVVDASRPS